ncbi:MAG: winged helix-turn-helix domain-containing protein, partial [Tepidisphaeraceae bacterium]
TAAICADRLRALMGAHVDGNGAAVTRPGGCPSVDESTLSVLWATRRCFLGYNLPFRLAARLSHRPNHYVPIDDLLRDVWKGDLKSPSTVRSTIRNLRKRLIRGGMQDLADAIHCEGGRYGLILNGNR